MLIAMGVFNHKGCSSPWIVLWLPSLHVLMTDHTSHPVRGLSCTTVVEPSLCHLQGTTYMCGTFKYSLDSGPPIMVYTYMYIMYMCVVYC